MGSLIVLKSVNLFSVTLQECMVDEDCGDQKYCLYRIENSKCLPCIATDMPCTKDEECCFDQMCVWGQCTVNASQGTAGTICQGQSDCRPDFCCAFQRGDMEYICMSKFTSDTIYCVHYEYKEQFLFKSAFFLFL
ncbi:hypothetical protein ATANTOWER_032727 [Ataeniobius toweri]|uniref:Dickkopf N-terminal cysteine-rich domain-containing protein n=1 Tax=Ataeniobius toweri TaxID=208326 RepID=A0ABU7ALJ0_9TELE|nr:hypothetical protein [Ataeniobius toweri]